MGRVIVLGFCCLCQKKMYSCGSVHYYPDGKGRYLMICNKCYYDVRRKLIDGKITKLEDLL